jgi:truncated hemoglobin YjbI
MAERMTTKQAMAILVADFDKQDEFFTKLKEYVEKHGAPPAKHAALWEKIKNEKPWRQDARVIAVMRKAAHKMARNENARRVTLDAAKAAGGNPVTLPPRETL